MVASSNNFDLDVVLLQEALTRKTKFQAWLSCSSTFMGELLQPAFWIASSRDHS